jgi:hypothetical protein
VGLSVMSRSEFPVLTGNENERHAPVKPHIRRAFGKIGASGRLGLSSLPQLDLFLFLAMVFWTVS